MNKTQYYTRQNKIQKALSKVVLYFKHDLRAVGQLQNKGIGIYNPKVKKWRVGVFLLVFGLSLLIPFTTGFILYKISWALK